MSENKSLAVLATETRQWLEAPERLGELGKCLPDKISPDAFMRIVMTTHLKNPKLHETTLQSRWLAIMEAAQAGLPLDGKHAALVPYKREAKFIPMFQGLIQAMYRHPRIALVSPPKAIFEGDVWDYEEGLKPTIRHKPAPRSTTPKPEEIIACYASAQIQGGGRPFVFMWRSDIEENHRNHSAAYKGGYGPWIDWPIPMYLKTPVRELSKYVPQSPELIYLASRDEDDDPEKAAPALYVPATASVGEVLDAIAQEALPLP